MRIPFAYCSLLLLATPLAIFPQSVFAVGVERLPPLPNIREICTASTAMTNTCLRAALQYRCFAYGSFSIWRAREIHECAETVADLVRILDVVQVPTSEDEKSEDDPVEQSGLRLKQVLFHKRLEAIFDDRRTASRFADAQASMQESVRFGRKNNLWDALNGDFAFDRSRTLAFIAPAIQDVSFGIWHLMYLGRKYAGESRARESRQITNLKAAREFVQLFQVNLEHPDFAFSPYPAIDGADASRIDRDLHPFLHHFYLSAYVAAELKRAGKTDAQSFFAAFLLNASYEIVKHDAKNGSRRWPLLDPRPFDPKLYAERLRKIYTGYVGALWGIGLEHQAKSAARFGKEFAADPYGTMREYFGGKF